MKSAEQILYQSERERILHRDAAIGRAAVTISAWLCVVAVSLLALVGFVQP